ncbi:MAG: pyrroline-5-carboxylate reductase [Ruminiclostridium sp.]|nr:pyrroline-5-carboxylate reductase [Ruminiclostridium sp.]
MPVTIGFIGAGNMGGALIKGLSGHQGQYELVVYDLNTALTAEMSKQYPVRIVQSAARLTSECQVIIAAVKPKIMESVLKEIAQAMDPSKLFITVAAGLPIGFYMKNLGDNCKIVRTMPNTPALIGQGMTVVSYGEHVSQEEKQLVREIFQCVGEVEELEEKLMSEVIALTSSSPAYVFMFIEAMADAAVQSGLPRSLSYTLAAQAVMGSARMVLETGKHPGELKDMVCSPAGTTIEAVAALERKGFRDCIITAMKKCTARAREIGRETGQ